MNHSFSIEIAQTYGVDEAIIIENLYFWISKNKANKKHFYDGNYWTYNSTKAFKVLFPYWSERQIDRIINSLKNQGAILIGNYNKKGYDRTRWFSLTMAVLNITPFGEMDIPNTLNGYTEKVEPIPVINTNINTDIYIEKLWTLYPNKKGVVIAKKKIPNLLKKYGYEKIEKCIEKYKKEKEPWKDWQMGSTFFTSGYADYIDQEKLKPARVLKIIDM